MTITPRSPSEFGVFRCIAAAEALLTSSVPTRFTLISQEEIARHRAVLAKQAPRRPDAGAVHRDIEAAQKRYGCGDRRIDRGFRGDVHAVKARGGASSATAAAPASALRSSSATRPPLAIRARAVASPSPEPPPVTAARVPRMSMTSEPKAAVDVEATSGKEIVLRDEQRGVRDSSGRPRRLSGTGP